MTDFNQCKDIYRSKVDEWVKFSGKPLDFFTRAKADHLLELLATRFQATPDLRLLDVGCGHGIIHPYVLEIPCRLTGVDVADEVIELAREANPSVEYRAFDGEHIPFDDQGFDAAFMICVMHHVPPDSWSTLLSEIRRVIAPGGMLVVFEHNPLNPLTQWIVRTNEFDRGAVLLSSGRLQKLMRRAQFVEIRKRFILFTPFDGAPFRKLDRSLGFLPLGAQYYVSARVPER